MAKLQDLRNARGWSRMKLAVESGLSLQSINRIEQGKAKKLQPLTRQALAKALNVSPDEITLSARRS